MPSLRYPIAAIALTVLVSVPAHAQARLDAATEKALAGTYSSDCGSATATKLRVTADALIVEDGTRQMQATSPKSLVSFYAGNPPPGFVTALLAEVKPGLGLTFEVFRTPTGHDITLGGHPTVLTNLGKLVTAQTYHRCSGTPAAPGSGGGGGIITTVAGNAVSCGRIAEGSPAVEVPLCWPQAVAVDKVGNVYVAATRANRVYRVDPAGAIHLFAGGGPDMAVLGDGGPAIRGNLSNPFGLAIDAAGNVFISDGSYQRIRKVTPAGIISTVAGSGNPGGYTGDGGPATDAKLDQPRGVAVDAAGNIYIAANNSHRVRKVTPDGIINTLAGSGPRGGGDGGDGGPALGARLFEPFGLAVDAAGNVYIGDQGNNRVRKVAPDGTITTVAGSGQQGFSGDGGPALQASLNNPQGVAVDAAGNLYIADHVNGRVRKVAPNGIITTVAGTGLRGSTGDGGPAVSAQIGLPSGVAVDGSGNLYIVDNENGRVRKVTFAAKAAAPTAKPETALTAVFQRFLGKDFTADWQGVETLDGFTWKPLPLGALPACLPDGSCSARQASATISGRNLNIIGVGTPSLVSTMFFQNPTAPFGPEAVLTSLRDAGFTTELKRCPANGSTATGRWYRLAGLTSTKPAYLSIQTQCSGKPCELYVLSAGDTLPALAAPQAPLYTEQCPGR